MQSAPAALGCERVRREIAKYSDWDVATMTAISMAESGCDQRRHNLTNTENHGSCVGSYGALQVGCIHYRPGEDVNDFATNIRVAHRVYKERVVMFGDGYTAWTLYQTGEYLQYL